MMTDDEMISDNNLNNGFSPYLAPPQNRQTSTPTRTCTIPTYQRSCISNHYYCVLHYEAPDQLGNGPSAITHPFLQV